MCFPSASWCISCVCSRGTDGSTLKQAQIVLEGGHYSGLRKTVDISNNSILRSLWWKWMTYGITFFLSIPLQNNSALIIEGFKSIPYLAVVMWSALLFRASLGKESPPTLTMLNSSEEPYCDWEWTARAGTPSGLPPWLADWVLQEIWNAVEKDTATKRGSLQLSAKALWKQLNPTVLFLSYGYWPVSGLWLCRISGCSWSLVIKPKLAASANEYFVGLPCRQVHN